MAYDEDGIWTPDPEPDTASAADEWAEFRPPQQQQQTQAAPAADEWAEFRPQPPQVTATAPTADEWAEFRPQQAATEKKPEAEGMLGTAAREVAHATPSTLGGLVLGAGAAGVGRVVGSTLGRLGGGVLGTVGGPAGTVAGWIGGGLAGGYIGEELAKGIKSYLGFDDTAQRAANVEANPMSAAAGQVAPLVLGLSPGRGAQIANRALSGAIGGTIEGASQIAEGEFSKERLIANILGGAALPGNKQWLSNIESRAAARTVGRPGGLLHPDPQRELPLQGGEAEAPTARPGAEPIEPSTAPDTQTGFDFEAQPKPESHGTPGAEAAAGTAEAQTPPTRAPGEGPEDWGKKTAPADGASGVNVGDVDPTLAHVLKSETPSAAQPAQQAGPMADIDARLKAALDIAPGEQRPAAELANELQKIAEDYRKVGQPGQVQKIEDVIRAIKAYAPPAAEVPPVRPVPAEPVRAAALERPAEVLRGPKLEPEITLPRDDIPGSYAETRAAPEPLPVDRQPANVAGNFRVEPNPAGPGHVIMRGDEALPGVYPTKGPAFIAMNKMAKEAPREPATLYHGTNREFTDFDPAHLQRASGSYDAAHGFYFTDDPQIASFFADNPKKGRIIEAQLDFKNPKTIKLDPSDATLNKNASIAEAFAAGHDAVIFKGSSEGKGPVTTTYIVPKTEQIRQRGSYPTAEALKRAAAAERKSAAPPPKAAEAIATSKGLGNRRVVPNPAGDGYVIMRGNEQLPNVYPNQKTAELIARDGAKRDAATGVLPKAEAAPLKPGSPEAQAAVEAFNAKPVPIPGLKTVPRTEAQTAVETFNAKKVAQQQQQAQQTQPPAPGSVEAAREHVKSRIAPEPSFWDKVPKTVGEIKDKWREIYTAAKNEIDPLEHLEKSDPTLKPEERFGMLASLTNGLRGRVSLMLEHNTYDINTRRINGAGLKQVLAPVHADMDNFTAYAMAKRAIELNKRGVETGIDTAQARQVVAADAAKYEKTFRDLTAYQDRQLDNLHRAGIISQESLLKMRKLNQEYVPFYRMIDPKSDLAQQVGAGLKVKDPIHGIKGSELEVLNPIDSIVKNTYMFTALAERNIAMRELERFGLKHPGVLTRDMSTHPVTVKKEELQRWLDKHGIADFADDVLTVFRPDTFRPSSDKVRVFVDGKARIYKVHDPAIANAVNAMSREQLHWMTQLLSKPASLLRLGAVYSPEFILRNPIRDQFTAWINSKHGYIPVYDMLKSLHELITVTRGGKASKDFQEWMIGGGANATLVGLDRKTIGMGGHTTLERVGNVIKSPLEALRIASELMENATRLGEFKRARGMGKTVTEAAFASREVTLDFARMGSQAHGINAIIPFFNAQLEGIDRTARAIRDNPVGTLTKIGMGITAPSVALWFANKDDARYQELPQWQKDLFWIVPTDKWVDMDAKDAARIGDAHKRKIGDQWQRNIGTIYRIPKPFEVGVIFGSLPERMLEAMYRDNPRAFKDFGKTAVQGLGPLGIFVNPKEGIKAWTPTAIDPMMEHFANRSSFQDRALVPKSMEDRKPEHQFNERTSETAKFAGHLIAQIDPKTSFGSPMIIDNYIRGYTGGLGQYMLGAMDKMLEASGAIKTPATKPTPTAADTYLLRAFVTRFPDSGAESIQRFYDLWDDRKTSKAEVSFAKQTGDKEEAKRLRREGAALIAADPIHKQIGMMHKQIAETMRDEKMSAEDKRAKIDTTYLKMITTAQRGVENFERRKAAHAPSQ